MGLINLGGRMPDGSRAQDLWIEETDFVCASGTALEGAGFKQILGKLCLTMRALVMLPYEGALVQAVELVAGQLRGLILNEYADLADAFERLGIIHQGYGMLDRVLVWPLDRIDDVGVEKKQFLFIRGGADLVVDIGGRQDRFNLKTRGHEVEGFASAQDFAQQIELLTGVYA